MKVTKGVDGKKQQVRRHLNVPNRAERDEGSQGRYLRQEFDGETLKTLAFIDEEREYTINSF